MYKYNKSKMVWGVGINDADYPVMPRVGNSQNVCNFYKTWRSMLERCYSARWIRKYPTYSGCSVASEWLAFSNFKRWMESQNWHGKDLDKDLLVVGNKIYSKETCIFIDPAVNKFISKDSIFERNSTAGAFKRPNGKWQAKCVNSRTGKQETIGTFDTREMARAAWVSRKIEVINQLAESIDDDIVKAAILNRYKLFLEG
jgi:hypothetical protein